MSEFLIIVYQIIKFLIMIGIGVICVKTHILKKENLPVISKLIMKVVLPVFIFTNTINGATRSDLIEDFMVLPISIGVYLIWMITGKILATVQRIEGDKNKVYQAAFIFGNVGFIGIPLISALYAEKGMVYIAIFTIIDQFMLWTYGVFLTSKERQRPSFISMKKMLNPPLVAIFLALIIVVSAIPLPEVVRDALKTVGNASSPLSLIYIGASMCFCNIGEILKRSEAYIGVLIKMICLPVLLYVTMQKVIGVGQTVSMTMALLTALPGMTTVPMMAKQNDMVADYCLSTIMFTQVASLITLPCVCYIILTLIK